MDWLIKNSKSIIVILSILLLVGTYHLNNKWGENASLYKDNVLIELIVGGGLSLIPLFIGIYIGKRSKEIHFNSQIEKLLDLLKENRINGSITEETCRKIVIKVSDFLGKEILAEDWYNNVYTKTNDKNIETCGVCGLNANVTSNRCDNCKLHCFHWQK
jgi:hypothetical protein